MSHVEQENQRTGLREVFDILAKAPPERLLSLTFQLGESPEENIVHALCLIVLQRQGQALSKLQPLRDNHLAKHLAEKWQMSGGKLEDFATHCGHFQEYTGESLAMMARVFKVLSEQRLCDVRLRNLAYQRALLTDDQKISNSENLEYDQLREEAKVVCGPQVLDWMCSPTDLKSGSYRDLNSNQDGGNPTLKASLSQGQSEKAQSLASPLQVSSSIPSYPSHLEISIPPTASFQDDKRSPETSDKYIQNPPILPVGELEAKNATGQCQTSEEPLMIGAKKHTSMNETFGAENIKLGSLITPIQTNKPVFEQKFALPTATNSFLPKMPVANEMFESTSAEEEEETKFYAFVILHAPEDADMADSMREKLETVIGSGSEGATFSEDFATPGKSTLRCLEDAINNTAFTILLLTRNFSRSRMQEIETNSAVINSINKKHKYNTVIPLLPRENCMPRQSIPVPLQTIVPLDENKNFERKIQKSLSPAKIKRLERLWRDEQTVTKQRDRQERLRHLNQHRKQLIEEIETARLLETEHIRLLMAQKCLLEQSVPPEQYGGDGRAWWQQQPNIRIEHANYIMIGNDSQMTVDLGGSAEKDNSNDKDEQ